LQIKHKLGYTNIFKDFKLITWQYNSSEKHNNHISELI